MIYKNSTVQFDVNSEIKRSISARIQFSTQDIGTAKLTFKLIKDDIPLPISRATHGKLFMRFTDGSQIYVNTEIEDALEGVIFYVLTSEQIKRYGIVEAELYVNYDNGQKLSVHKFSFEIDRALVDQDIVPVAEYYIEDFETLKAVIKDMAADAETILAELQAKFEDLDNIETKTGAQEKADAAESGAKTYTDEHAAKIDNPHKVTKSQVGLSNVDNVKQAAKTDFDAHTADNVRHVTADERTKWSAGQLFKITGDDGQPLVYVNATDDFHELLPRYKGFIHLASHPNAINGPGVALRGFWNCNLAGTHGQIIAFDNSNRTFRKTISNGNWSDWEVLETQSGSQAKVDAHANNKTVHVTAAERTKWNNAQLYKLTQDNGERILIPDGTDLLTLPSGLYYGVSNKVVNSPEPNAVEWFHYDVSTNNTRKTIIVTATANPKRWFGTIHTDGSFKGWQRFITDADAVVTWQSPTLLNGWKQYGTQKVQFSKNALGEVELIGSVTGGTIGFDVPAFTLPVGYRPLQMTHFIGVASSLGTGSTPQYHRTQIATDGTVYIQSCSNTVNPNEFITFGFKFKAA
ncbi:phage baseplate upper protein [Bacillus haynesii]|uniref:phage baseplate upper protein n=1 Tax=Bacillus haynesii TaxID=1925021 RepID=UPI00227EC8BC|nr:phage baseplate upper protein [Bacillus haynesii]MCY8609876.1 phage baseplate upper protein [Bacillus haynesii]